MELRTLIALVIPSLLAACASTAPTALPNSTGSRTGSLSSELASPSGTTSTALAPASTALPQGGGRLQATQRQAFVGLGITDSPATLLVGGELDIYMTDRLAIGPMLQLGFDDNTEIIAPSFQAKYIFPLDKMPGAPQFVPFVQGGAGFAWMQKDRGNNSDEGLGTLLQLGGGLEARFDDNFSLASTVLVNLLPDKVLDERLYWSWQIVQFGVRF
jgi:hypothetical protein